MLSLVMLCLYPMDQFQGCASLNSGEVRVLLYSHGLVGPSSAKTAGTGSWESQQVFGACGNYCCAPAMACPSYGMLS